LALADAALRPRGYLPLGILLVIVMLSFGENIEIEAYLLWPGLMVLGIHAREVAADPDRIVTPKRVRPAAKQPAA
jgi:hypothetical protein